MTTMTLPQTSGNHEIHNSDYRLGLPATAKEEETRERDRARRNVLHGPGRSDCIHACTVPDHDADPDACTCVFACQNPHHERDTKTAAELLDMLGLAAPPPSGPVEPVPTADEKRCSKCQEIKLRAEFWRRPGAGDGLRSQCKDCSKATKKKSASQRPADPKRQRGNDRNITWRTATPGGRGMDCTREGVDERRDTYGRHIRAGRTPRQAAEEMRIGMRTARRYGTELRDRGQL
jgi:hypothetical protein